MEDTASIVVLRSKPHGISSHEFADSLRGRLPAGYAVSVAETPQEERDLIQTADIAVGMSITEDLLERSENLRLFACGSAGVGHLPREALDDNDVVVTNASGVHRPNIGEHVLGFMLAMARRFPRAWDQQSRREWRHYTAFGELSGSTVTIVGLGALGTAVVERLAGFDVTTIGVRYTPSKGGPTDDVIGFDPTEFHAALAQTDYLVLATPLTDTTRGLVDAEALKTLPPHAVVVNVARGPVVETDALVTALRKNYIHGAALDVTDPEPLPEDHPLWGFKNVFITPHMSGHTAEYWVRLADILLDNLATIEETGTYYDLRNQVIP